MGLFSTIGEAFGASPLNEDDVTLTVKDTDTTTVDAPPAADMGAGDAAATAPVDDATAPTDEDADTLVDVINTADKPIVPVSGAKAAPTADTSNAEVQDDMGEDDVDGEGDGPADVSDAFDPKEDTTIGVEEEGEDPGAIRPQELTSGVADATQVATDGARAAVAFSNVGGNEYTDDAPKAEVSDSVSEDFGFYEDEELDIVD
jgi:hypothetical protein